MDDYEDYTPDFAQDRQAAAEWARRASASIGRTRVVSRPGACRCRH